MALAKSFCTTPKPQCVKTPYTPQCPFAFFSVFVFLLNRLSFLNMKGTPTWSRKLFDLFFRGLNWIRHISWFQRLTKPLLREAKWKGLYFLCDPMCFGFRGSSACCSTRFGPVLLGSMPFWTCPRRRPHRPHERAGGVSLRWAFHVRSFESGVEELKPGDHLSFADGNNCTMSLLLLGWIFRL